MRPGLTGVERIISERIMFSHAGLIRLTVVEITTPCGKVFCETRKVKI